MLITKKRHEAELLKQKEMLEKSWSKATESAIFELRRESQVLSDLITRTKALNLKVRGPVQKDWEYKWLLTIDPNLLIRLVSGHQEAVKYLADDIARRAYKELMAFARLLPKGKAPEKENVEPEGSQEDGQDQ